MGGGGSPPAAAGGSLGKGLQVTCRSRRVQSQKETHPGDDRSWRASEPHALRRGPGVTGRKGVLPHPEEALQAGPQQATQGFPEPTAQHSLSDPHPSSLLCTRLPKHMPLGHQPGGSLSPFSCLVCPQAPRGGDQTPKPTSLVCVPGASFGVWSWRPYSLCAQFTVGVARLSRQQKRDPSKGDLQMRRATHKKKSLQGCVYLDPRRMFPGNGISSGCWSLANLSG